MLKRTMTAALTIILLVTAGSAMAQCVIGVYADAAGTQSTIEPILFASFDVFVVLRNEASVEGASYLLTAPPLTQATPPGSGFYGPDEAGLSIVTPGGENVGFSNCEIGFGGNAVRIARYVSTVYDIAAIGGTYEVTGNVDEGPNPVHATCNGFLLSCDNTVALEITDVIAAESKSFGAVKSLY